MTKLALAVKQCPVNEHIHRKQESLANAREARDSLGI